MAALIGALRVALGLDSAQFEAGAKRAQKTTNSLAKNFGGLRGEIGLLKSALTGLAAGLSVGLFVNAIKGALDYAGSLGEISQQLGVTTRELQVFRFAAQQNNITQEEADKGLQKLTLSMSKAASGSKQTIAAFNAVGVSLDDIKNKGAVEIFGQMADGMNKAGGASKNAAAGAVIMGRSFQKFVPLADQGSAGLNELAQAAETLGIVLSDRQIQQADETADKLDALQTVLKAQIAGVVADNADSILGLADAIAQVARDAAAAIAPLRKFYTEARIAALEANNALSRRFDDGLLGQLGIGNANRAANRAANQSQIDALRQQQADARFSALFRGRPKPPPRPRVDLPQFLASDKSKKGKEDHTAERLLRQAHQFDQDIRRAQMDVLQALRDLSNDAIERYALSVQIKDAEKGIYEAELKYQTQLHKLTNGEQGLSDAQARKLKLEYDRVNQLERDKLIADENHRAFEESARLDSLTLELERDELESQEQLARTAAEQRAIRLKILDYDYRIERARLETVIADEQASDAAKEDARRRLAALNRTYGNDRTAVMQSTMGPLESFFSEVPRNAAEAQEAMERLQVHGIGTAIDGIIQLSQGFENWRDIALNAIQSVLAELLRMQLMKLAFNIFGAASGGGLGTAGAGATSMLGGFLSNGVGPGALLGFANGGSMMLGGRGGIDKNVLSLNGLPIARVSRGEMMHITPEGGSTGGGNNFNITVSGAMSTADARRTGMQIALAANQEMARARQKGLG